MKIAITGHSAGIGQALSNCYQTMGYQVVGLSRRNGFNIRNIPSLVEQIKDCDVFVNNAQIGFAQTELLFAVYKEWQDIENKKIINISTMMTLEPISCLPGIEMIEYHNQKLALEQAHRQLLHLHSWPKLCLVKPGAIATQPGQTAPRPFAEVNAWAERLVSILDCGLDLDVGEIALGVNYP